MKNMDMVYTPMPMANNIKVGGYMATNTEKDKLSPLKVNSNRAYGIMEIELVVKFAKWAEDKIFEQNVWGF